MHLLTQLFVIMALFATATQLYLNWRQRRAVMGHRQQVPTAFAQKVSLDEHQKAADYTRAKLGLASITTLYALLLLFGWTIGGGLSWLDALCRTLELSPLWTGVAFILSLMMIGAILELPFSLYATFSIEQRFGFNRSSLALYFGDMAKQALLLLLLGIPLIALVLWLMASSGPLWWLYVWAAWFSFSLMVMWAYPAFIAPLFNRFTPLEDKVLEGRVTTLLERCGFAANGIFSMDGSRRSGHGNAYFSGLGKNKRIVFFDTLLTSLDHDQIEAVLAHELGHFRHHHIRKRLLLMAVTGLLGLALLGWLIDQPWFYWALGAEHPSSYMALVLFMLVIPVFTFFLQPIFSYSSRRHEFEADTFAAQQSDARALIQALVTLYRENANTLTPDHLYSAFHDSHPPAPVRIAHLETTMGS